jgi:two-component system, sensor histidine kinase and response regulator
MPYRLLLVDDDEALLSSMRRLLRRETEFILQTAPGGAEAIEALDAWRPDLVLLDVQMPGVGGHEVCRRIRAHARHRLLKVILVSGRSETTDRLAGYSAGADDFLSKPFDRDELLAKVRVFARLKRAEELDEIKGSVLTLFAHETRTPLTAILGAAEMLLTDPTCTGPQREMLTVIRDSGQRLSQFTQKTLRLCQLKGALDLHPTREPVAIRLAGLAQRYADVATTSEVRVTVGADAGLHLSTDWTLLDEALGHVLHNAVRVTPAQGQVTLWGEVEGSHAVIRVADEGPGVPSGWRARLFDEFAVQDLLHHHSGHGLSLALARVAVEALGGGIKAGDASGGGAVITLDLPGALVITGGTAPASSSPEPCTVR